SFPAILPPLAPRATEMLARSLAWWERWASKATCDGPRRDAVVRSALTVKPLAYAPSGAVAAAPTPSLPERPGGSLNWDYRYCWLRDAALTSRALFGLGHRDEAEAFVSWLLTAASTTWPRVHVLYDVFGRPPPEERELPHLRGYEGARPVRVGNAAKSQLQLDLYGELVGAVRYFVEHGGELDRAARRMLGGLGRSVCEMWRQPDHGIWGERGPDAVHLRAHPAGAGSGRRAVQALRGAAHRGRRCVRHLQLLGGRMSRARRRHPRGSDRPVRGGARVRKRRRPLRRGDRAGDRRGARQLSPGLHPSRRRQRRPHPRGATQGFQPAVARGRSGPMTLGDNLLPSFAATLVLTAIGAG